MGRATIGNDTIRRVKPEIATQALLATGVTGVTEVQPNTGAGFAVTPPEVSGVTGVTPPQDYPKVTASSHGAHCTDMALLGVLDNLLEENILPLPLRTA